MHILKCILLLHFIDNLDRHRCLVWNTFSLEFWRYYTIAFLLLVLLLRSQKSFWFLTPFYYMGALRRFSLSAVCWKFTVIRFLWVPFNLEICILPLSPRLPLHPSKFSWIILLVISSFISFYIFCMFIFLCCSGGDILRSVFQFSTSRLIVIFSYHVKINTSFYYLYWLLLNGMFDYCPFWDNLHMDYIFYFISEYYKYIY